MQWTKRISTGTLLFRPHLHLVQTLQNKAQSTLRHLLAFIDFSKALDYVQIEYLLHKPLNFGITGNIYTTIKSIHTNPLSCVQLNGSLGDLLPINAAVRQEDSRSPVTFAAFMNDFTVELEAQNIWIMVGLDRLPFCMYPGGIVMLAMMKQQPKSSLTLCQIGAAIGEYKSMLGNHELFMSVITRKINHKWYCFVGSRNLCIQLPRSTLG